MKIVLYFALMQKAIAKHRKSLIASFQDISIETLIVIRRKLLAKVNCNSYHLNKEKYHNVRDLSKLRRSIAKFWYINNYPQDNRFCC
jgi:hypothetical protein